MMRSFGDILSAARSLGRVKVAVAAAQDREVLVALQDAYEQGFIDPILVGNEKVIRSMLDSVRLPASATLIDEPEVERAAAAAVRLVREGEAQVLMKGLLNTSTFLHAALDPTHGLRSGKLLAHLAVFEIPGQSRLAYHTDGGMNVAPTLDEKREILVTAVQALRAIGIETPNVAVLAANEQITNKMPVTVDAQALVDMWKAGLFPPCVVEGPMAMDVASSAEAAAHKSIASQIAGQVDLFLFPTIEAGNLVGKTLVWYARAKHAGVIVGARRPMVLVSRSDRAEAKLNSIALSCLIASQHGAAAPRPAVRSNR